MSAMEAQVFAAFRSIGVCDEKASAAGLKFDVRGPQDRYLSREGDLAT